MNVVVAGRGTPWGNPYRLGGACSACGAMHEERGSTLACFEAYARERLLREPTWLDPLRGARLGCPGCPDGALTCHVRVLERLVAEPRPLFCGPCRGTGHYHARTADGPKRTSLRCFKCGGKGYQVAADVRRNWGWQQHERQRHAATYDAGRLLAVA